jgi:hypothetical protein
MSNRDPVKMSDSEIVWDFYPGAYGPSILAELPDRAAVELLQDIFVRVGTTDARVELSNQPRMRLENIARLELARASHPSRKTLSRSGDISFVWSCTAEQWNTLAALLEPLLDRPGHQYLTDEGIDDALIEVSFGEQHG